MSTFKDRREAGRLLAYKLDPLKNHGATVIALSWGGLPVAFEIARWLSGPLGVMKPLPRADATRGEPALGEDLSRPFLTDPPPFHPVQVAGAPTEELRLRGRTVILVDDLIATGVAAVMLAGAIDDQGPRRLILATPVGAESTLRVLQERFDEVISLQEDELIENASRYYENLDSHVPEEELRRHLRRA